MGVRAVARTRPARVEASRLFVGGEEIRVGAAVSVRSETLGVACHGVLAATSPSEVIVRMADDSRVRVLLSHLRSRRVSIAALPDVAEEAAEDAAAAEQVREGLMGPCVSGRQLGGAAEQVKTIAAAAAAAGATRGGRGRG